MGMNKVLTHKGDYSTFDAVIIYSDIAHGDYYEVERKSGFDAVADAILFCRRRLRRLNAHYVGKVYRCDMRCVAHVWGA